MGFATGFITGLAKSVDEQLKTDMKRTQDRLDGMAQYRVTRRRAQLERKDKEKEELRESVLKLASLVGGDTTKAIQMYKAAGNNVSDANNFYNVAVKSQRSLGKDFDISKAIEFSSVNTPANIKPADYLNNFVDNSVGAVKPLPAYDEDIPATGLYGALFKPKLGKQVMKQTDAIAPLPKETTTTDTSFIPAAKINFNEFMEYKAFEKSNRFESGSTNEATLLKIEDEMFYTKDKEKLAFLKEKRQSVLERMKEEHNKKIAVKQAGTSESSMFSKTNRDKIINNGITRGVNDSNIVKSLEGELVTQLEGNEHKIYAGTLRGMENLKKEYGETDNVLSKKINSVIQNTQQDIKAYKYDFRQGVNLRGKTYHTLGSKADLEKGVIGERDSAGKIVKEPKVKPGDVVTYKTGEMDERGNPKTKTVIWTGVGFL
jgi:hypothetical protein